MAYAAAAYQPAYQVPYDPRLRAGWTKWLSPDPPLPGAESPELDLEPPVLDLFPDPQGAVPSFAPPPKLIEQAPLPPQHPSSQQPKYSHDHLYWGTPGVSPAGAAHDPLMYNFAVDAWPADIQNQWTEIQANPTVPSILPAMPAYTPAHKMGPAARQSIQYDAPDMPFYAPQPPMPMLEWPAQPPPLSGPDGMPPLLPAPPPPGMDMALVLASPPAEARPFGNYINNINKPAIVRPPSAQPGVALLTGPPPLSAASPMTKSPFPKMSPAPPAMNTPVIPAAYGTPAPPKSVKISPIPTPAQYPYAQPQHPGPFFYGAAADKNAAASKENQPELSKKVPKHRSPADPDKPLKSALAQTPYKDPADERMQMGQMYDAIAALDTNTTGFWTDYPKPEPPAAPRAKASGGGRKRGASVSAIPTSDHVYFAQNQQPIYGAPDATRSHMTPTAQLDHVTRQLSEHRGPGRLDFAQPAPFGVHDFFGNAAQPEPPQPEPPTPNRFKNLFGMGAAANKDKNRKAFPQDDLMAGMQPIAPNSWYYAQAAPPPEKAQEKMRRRNRAASIGELRFLEQQSGPPPLVPAAPVQRSVSTKKGKKNSAPPPPPTQVGLNYADLTGAYAGGLGSGGGARKW